MTDSSEAGHPPRADDRWEPSADLTAADLMPNSSEEIALLSQRAELLAQTRRGQSDAEELNLHLLHIRLEGDTNLAVPYPNLVEVLPPQRVTRVPGAPTSVLGVVNFSGTILTVMDLGHMLQLPEQTREGEAVIVVGSGGTSVAFPVTELVGAVDVRSSSITAAPHSPASKRGYLVGVVGNSIGVLDVDRILSDERLLVDHR